jgi:general secretion pathway protein L
VLAVLTDISDWWTRVMRGIVFPRRSPDPHMPVVTILRDRLEVVRRAGDNGTVTIPQEEMAPGLAGLRRGRGALRGPVMVRLEPDRFVTRQISGFAVPLSRQRQMAAFDITASTPFPPDTVHAVLTEPEGKGAAAAAQYHVIRKSVIDPVVAALRQAGLPIARIVLAGEDGRSLRLRADDLAVITGRTRARAARRMLASALAALLVASVAGTFAHAWWRYDKAVAEVTAISQPLAARAKQVRQALDDREARMTILAALRTEIAESRTATEVWEELTRVLPDSAWLTDMVMTPEAVRISGFSRAAPAIIAPLEGSPLFRNAEFTAPVVRVPGQNGQRFSIQMELSSP